MYQRSFVLNDRLLQACQQLGFTPKESGRSGQADFLAALVAAGQGVVLLPSVVARGLVRPGVVRLTLKAPDYLLRSRSPARYCGCRLPATGW